MFYKFLTFILILSISPVYSQHQEIPRNAEVDRFDALLNEDTRSSTLQSLKNSRSNNNCPLLANVVEDFLDSGNIPRRSTSNINQDPWECIDSFTSASLNRIIRIVERRGHGTNVVVGATGRNIQHYFNLLNIRGHVYEIDIYNSPIVFREVTDARKQRLNSTYNSFSYSTDYQPRTTPIDRAESTCRNVAGYQPKPEGMLARKCEDDSDENSCNSESETDCSSCLIGRWKPDQDQIKIQYEATTKLKATQTNGASVMVLEKEGRGKYLINNFTLVTRSPEKKSWRNHYCYEWFKHFHMERN